MVAEYSKLASVAIIYTAHSILFIKRSIRLHDRWSGHVGFPGGRHKPNESSYQACIRETHEEIGVDLSTQEYCGCLCEVVVNKWFSSVVLLTVSVHLFKVDSIQLVLDPKEVEYAFWIPIASLRILLKKPGYISVNSIIGPIKFPMLDLGPDRELWGLTLYFVTRFLNQQVDMRPLFTYWPDVNLLLGNGYSIGPDARNAVVLGIVLRLAFLVSLKKISKL